jgi:two-component system sensor histidine kinase/response regulator
MKKILVIEDEPFICSNIEEILILSDYEAITAHDGLTGLELAKEKLPDLIICDVMLPYMDGYEVVSMLRQDKTTAQIPFIFLTAKSDRADQRQGMELGANDYLTKPFSPQELLRAVASQFKKQDIVKTSSQDQLTNLRNNISLAIPHEINTPLNGILGFSSLLMQDHSLLNSPEGLEIIECIHQSAQRLNRLVQNFLMYTQLELIATNAAQLKELKNADTMSIIKDIINDVAYQKASEFNRPEDLELSIENDLVKIDPNYFTKVIEEIIDNAFKFSSPQTPIRVTGKVIDGEYHLTITDFGRGMTPEQIAQIGAYMQFDRRYYEQQGSGLGLIVAKRVVEIYGGKFEIKTILNQQTTINIKLPIKQFK